MQPPPLDPQLLDELARVFARAALEQLLAADLEPPAEEIEQEAAARSVRD